MIILIAYCTEELELSDVELEEEELPVRSGLALELEELSVPVVLFVEPVDTGVGSTADLFSASCTYFCNSSLLLMPITSAPPTFSPLIDHLEVVGHYRSFYYHKRPKPISRDHRYSSWYRYTDSPVLRSLVNS